MSDKEIKNNDKVIIEHLKSNKDNKLLLKDIKFNECNTDLKQNQIMQIKSDGKTRTSGYSESISYIRDLTNMLLLRCVIKMTEYTPISGGNISELNKIPDLFLNKRSLLILRNNDNKCFLYCYIREILNPITRNRLRITKRDKELADEIINETNLNFDNVSISEIDKIEKKLKVNVNVFSCNKNYKNKNPVRKSRENYDKILDLLLIEDINHNIIIKNLYCFLTDRRTEKDNFICRICLNIFYCEIKYNEHMNYCKTGKSQRLMPSNEKHIKFNKLQNCMLNNFVIYSDFECIIDKNNEHKFISGGYLVKCRNDKFTKPVQIFDNLDDYCENLKNELKYIEKNDKHLNYRIDMKTFDKEKFDNTTHCEYCNYKFDKDYNDRKIESYERVDKNKLNYIIDNYKFNEETENILKLYYESLNKKGQKKIIYNQSKENKNRYFGGICLTKIKRCVRNSIMPDNILDIDMENSHPRILLYLCKKHKIYCEKLNEYINNRECFLSNISDNRKEAKTLILQMLNGGFKNKYSNNRNIIKFLKDFELEIKNIQNKVYELDNRFDDKSIFNYKDKSLSRILLELENKILQVIVDFFKFKNIQIFTLEYDGLKIINKPEYKHFSINQLEYIILIKTGINMKLAIKEINDEFPEYKTNVNTDNLPKNKIICKNNKVIHHDHCLPENNILGYICQNCNLQIKNKKEIPIIFHNGMNYDNSILLNGMSKFKPIINCIGITSEKFKSIEFKFKEYEMADDGEAHEIKSNYSLRVIDSYNLIMGS